MVDKYRDGTFVSSDVGKIFNHMVGVNETINTRIKEVSDQSNIFLCKILRFYTVSDKALVKILNTGETVTAHLTHDILDKGISIRSMNRGTVHTSSKGKTYLEPYEPVYGIVALVRWENTDDEYCLLTCVNIHGNDDFKNIVGDGEIILTVGNSKISLTNERVNIMTPYLFINGLPYDSPELTNVYDKKEADEIITKLEDKVKELERRIDNLTSLI